MENNFIVSVNPHVYGKRNTTGVMLDVIIALLPAVVASVVLFGARAAMVIGVCVVSCVIFEYLFTLICKRPVSVGDLSAVVTGILLALNIPSTIPLWQAVVGSFIAIVVVKCLFGGIGRNFANPAITARVVMLIAFTGTMTDIVFPVQKVDTVATATPLSALPMGGVEAVDASLAALSVKPLRRLCFSALSICLSAELSPGTPPLFSSEPFSSARLQSPATLPQHFIIPFPAVFSSAPYLWQPTM